jgi:hypothetical protein
MSTSKVEQFHKHPNVKKETDLSQTIEIRRQRLADQLRRDEASEDAEHVIDWLEDAWATFDMLKERFGEARARQLYTSDLSPICEQAETYHRLQTCLPVRDERR